MKIEYDDIYGEYVVWKVQQSAYIEKFRSKRKKDCKEYISRNKRKK